MLPVVRLRAAAADVAAAVDIAAETVKENVLADAEAVDLPAKVKAVDIAAEATAVDVLVEAEAADLPAEAKAAAGDMAAAAAA